MRNIDITEWLLDNQINSETKIVMDGKQVFLADVLEKHLIEQFAISDFVGQSEQFTPKQLWKMAQKYNADDFIQMVKKREG
jgi:hypothetical protein